MSQDPTFEQKKRSVITTLNSVLRTSALKDQDIGQQRLVLLIDQVLDRAGPNSPVPLAPLYEYLKERRIEEDAILEALLVFKEREDTLGVKLELPAAVEQLPKERRQRLLLRYEKNQRAPRPKAAPPPSETTLPTVDARKAADRPTNLRTKLLAGGLVAATAIGGGTYLWLEQTREPLAVTVVIDDPAALKCNELTGNQGILMCWMAKQAYEGIGPSERKTRALATKAAAAGLGYDTLQVWTVEDTRLREVH